MHGMDWGSRGREFKSRQPDQKATPVALLLGQAEERFAPEVGNPFPRAVPCSEEIFGTEG